MTRSRYAVRISTLSRDPLACLGAQPYKAREHSNNHQKNITTYVTARKFPVTCDVFLILYGLIRITSLRCFIMSIFIEPVDKRNN
jgi:hypothetical protein